MNIYQGLAPKESVEIDDFLASVSASVINQYILEDGIIKEDREDRRVEMMMRYAEGFFLRFLTVTKMEQEKGREAVVRWMNEQMAAFDWHAKLHQPMYQQIAHLADPPHFVTSWSMCYLVAESLNAHDIPQEKPYSDLSEAERQSVDYILRFGENLMMELHSRVMK